MIRNLNYHTDRQPDNGGLDPRFKATALKDVLVPAELPPWFKGRKAEDFVTREMVVLTAGGPAGWNLLLPQLGAYKLVWLPNA